MDAPTPTTSPRRWDSGLVPLQMRREICQTNPVLPHSVIYTYPRRARLDLQLDVTIAGTCSIIAQIVEHIKVYT